MLFCSQCKNFYKSFGPSSHPFDPFFCVPGGVGFGRWRRSPATHHFWMRPWDALEISVTILPVCESYTAICREGTPVFYRERNSCIILVTARFAAKPSLQGLQSLGRLGSARLLQHFGQHKWRKWWTVVRFINWHGSCSPMARWLQLCSSLGRATCHSFRGGVVLEGIRDAFDCNWSFQLVYIVSMFSWFYVIPDDWAREPCKKLLIIW